MKTLTRLLGVVALTAMLAGCATPAPFREVTLASPPAWAVAEHPEAHLDQHVLWGGMILQSSHQPNYTELEMLAFPLDAAQQPQAQLADEGRFVLIVAGFLDPADYAPGRFLTFPGRITGARRGELRNQPHVWPMLDAVRLHLWPKDFREQRSSYSIGIGVLL